MIERIPTIQDMYKLTGFDRVPIFEDFDICTHQETYPSTKQMVPAQRREFFSLIFLENQQEGEMHINDSKYAAMNDILFCQGPEHVFSFVRGASMRGFLVFFKLEFLFPYVQDVVSTYPFFSSDTNNLFQLNAKEKEEFVPLLHMLRAEANNREVAKSLLMALLAKTKILQEKHQTIEKAIPREYQILNDFKRLVNNHFIEEKSVEFYAQKLSLTANYLNNRVKAHTGKTAKEHIADRTIIEAKNMLLYTELDIAEIAYRLNFTEASYFGKYFKKHTQQTPKAFRQNR